MSNQDIYKITKSPPEQYSYSNMDIKKIGEEIKSQSEYENAIIVFDIILGSSNSRDIGQYFIKGRHKKLNVCCLSQSYFD